LRIKFIDSGLGLPEGVADKIMTPFFTTKEAGKGTGLGLSVCSGIIRDHNGQLYIDSKANHTTFVIDLPINNYFGTVEWLNTGKKISIDYLEQKENGKYLIITDKFFSIIEIEEGDVKYLLNKVLKV
jgi:hydrogenase maturation factor